MNTIQPETVQFSSSRLERIKPAMQAYVDNKTFAGILTFASRRGKLFHAEAFGMMDIQSARPMQFDAIFRIYSMSKPITSVAAMILFEEGRLRLTDPISRYLPAFKHTMVFSSQKDDRVELVKADREITFRDLLTHTSGLSYGSGGNAYLDTLYQDLIMTKFYQKADTTLADTLQALPTIPLYHQPGTTWHYSLATDLLGYLIQIAADMPFETFLKERIIDPLGMVDTAFFVPPEKLDRFACNYGRGEDGGLMDIDPIANTRYTHPHHTPAGGSGLVSTAHDYLRFAHMLVNKGELDGARLLSPKSVALMTMNHLPDGVYINPERSAGFGLGFSVIVDVAKTQNLGSVGNFGWGGAASTYFWIDPQEELVGLQLIQFIPNNTPAPVDFTNLVYQALQA